METKTYEDGLREAWDLARRIVVSKDHGGFAYDDMEDIFKNRCVSDIFMYFTPQQAAECIALWEARSKFQVGDQVRLNGTGKIGVITKILHPNCFSVFWSDGSAGFECTESLTKTGRTVDVEAFLAQIGGTECATKGLMGMAETDGRS